MKTDVKSQSPASLQNTGKPRVVLVGTYKGDQLEKWPGWYCWPVSNEECKIENVKCGDGNDAPKDGVSGNFQFSIFNFQFVSELWLFRGTAEQRNYRAEFVGVKTREELIRDYGYPAKGKAHGDKYALFKPAQEVA